MSTSPMNTRTRKKTEAVRPKRGAPTQTRERLVISAGALFNRVGFHGTDSNRIAKEAGYSTGTFYKHFQDKREIFLAVYDAWVTSEWEAISAELSAGSTPRELAQRVVERSIEFHTKWRGLRASLIELVFTDAEVRRAYRRQRNRQLDLMPQLRQRFGIRPGTREEDAIHLFTAERTYDAIGQKELEALGLDHDTVVEAMVQRVLAMLA
jgi:AcrR family transcriptional regulator